VYTYLGFGLGFTLTRNMGLSIIGGHFGKAKAKERKEKLPIGRRVEFFVSRREGICFTRNF